MYKNPALGDMLRDKYNTWLYLVLYLSLGTPLMLYFSIYTRGSALSNICDWIGYWKTDYNVTLGQLLFIGLANSHTHTLPVHCCISRLS